MPVDVIVGGQGGDEGKGLISEYLSYKNKPEIIIRVSKPQAGHSMIINGKRVGLTTIPCGYADAKRVLIGRGAFIDVEQLQKEIEKTNIDKKRLGIDSYATIVQSCHVQEENRSQNLMEKIGSVGTGAGPATRDKIMRSSKVKFAKDCYSLKPYLTDTVKELHETLEKKGQVLLEGDQGFKLSLLHGEWPYVTSCDTTTSTLLAKAGINPRELREVHMVLKPYTTRVGPGPLQGEITGNQTLYGRNLEWFHNQGGETGTVSGRLRRIGEFEWHNVKRAAAINGATHMDVTHVDVFTKDAERDLFLLDLMRLYCLYPSPTVGLFSTGPKLEDIKEYQK